MKNFLWKIYASRFLDSFILIGVIFTLFFNNAGLNPFQISELITIWSITTILTEVPFGVFADTYSRKNLLIIGLILRALGFYFWYLGGFVNYAIGFILWGLKNTLTSGTLEALVYDELVFYKKEGLYEEVNGKMSSAFSLGLTLSAVFGGLVAQINFNWVLIASIVTSLLGGLVLLTLKSVKPVQSTGEVNYYKTLKESVLEIHKNKSLLFVIIFICFIFAAFGATDEYWALIYDKFNLTPTVIGFLVALVYGLGSIAGYTIKYFKSSSKIFGYILLLIGALLYVILGLTKTIFILPIAFVAIYLFQIASIKLEAELQHNISSHQRATISSLKSLVFELVYMGYVLLFGFVGDKFGVVNILTIAGTLIIVGVIGIPFVFRKKY